jgi:hypothetical protein
MNAMRIALAMVLLVGCTKAAAPPPPSQPPADDVAQAEASDEPEASEPVPEIDNSVLIEGPLTEAQVRAVAQEHFSEIQACFDAALVRMDSPNLNGAIAVRIEIDAGGAVTKVELEASSFGDEETPACIIGKVETWTFPKAAKAKKPSTVVYPFFLRSY